MGKILSLLISGFVLMNSAEVRASTLKEPKDFDRLFDLCETDWEHYDSELTRLRQSLKREIADIPQSDFVERWRGDDPMINFVRIHWPSLFTQKDPGWEFYKVCSDRNWEARKAIGSSTSTKKQKLDAIDSLNQCLTSTFTAGKPVKAPFDRLLTCYKKNAAK